MTDVLITVSDAAVWSMLSVKKIPHKIIKKNYGWTSLMHSWSICVNLFCQTGTEMVVDYYDTAGSML